jgi:hypothetical protein
MSGDAGNPTDGVLGFDHLALPMQNTAAMVDFYRSLGLPVEEHAAVVRVFLGDQMINFHLPEFWLGDFPLRAPAARPPCGDLCLVWPGTEESLPACSVGPEPSSSRVRWPGREGAGPSGRASTSATRTAISSNS